MVDLELIIFGLMLNWLLAGRAGKQQYYSSPYFNCSPSPERRELWGSIGVYCVQVKTYVLGKDLWDVVETTGEPPK